MPSNGVVKNEVTAYIKTEEKTTDETTPDIVTIPTKITGDLIVEYIYVNEDGEIKELDSYSKNDYVGNAYTTEAKQFNSYALKDTPVNASGIITEETTRVTYFYTKIPVEIKENVVEKTAQEVVKNINDAFNYTISYKTVLDNYIGDTQVVIVDKLSYPIDINKSTINDGIYDEEKLTITWLKDYQVNTYENKNNIIDFDIDISLYYKNLNANLDKVINEVSTKLYLDTVNNPIESNDTSETKLEISGKVIAKYVDEYGNDLLNSIVTTGLVGEKYQTSSENIEGYVLNKINGNETGEYVDGEIEVIYVYTKQNNDVILPPQTNANSYVHISFMITLLGIIISIKKIIKL